MLYALLLKLIRVSRGYLTVVLPSTRLERLPCKPSPSLLDQDGPVPAVDLGNRPLPSTEISGDFIGFDGGSDTDEGDESAFDGIAYAQEEDKEPLPDRDLWTLLDTPQGSSKKIDCMIESNLSDFSGQDHYCSSAVNYSGVNRRRLHGDSKVL